MSHVVVVGAGLSGLVSALLAAKAGHRVSLVTKGLGGLQLSQGTIDILGYVGSDHMTRVTGPFAAFSELPENHPYHVIGADHVRAGVEALQAELPDLLVGDMNANQLYPTAVGALRPTALVQPSMLAGACTRETRFAIVGVRQLRDFQPDLIAGNISRTDLPGGGRITARSASIALGARPGEIDSPPVVYARALDIPETRAKLVAAIKKVVHPTEIVGFPAVLGLNDPHAHADIREQLGQPIFEIGMQPPSIPGMRLNLALTAAVKKAGVRVILGSEVQGLNAADGHVTSINIQVAGRIRELACDEVIHCPGGFESGALAMDSHLNISEAIFDLPLVGTDAPDLVHGDYWGKPQPLFEVGVATDEQMRVLGPDQQPVYDNLRAAGGILAGAMRWSEKSGEGIALGSAHAAVASLSTTTTIEESA